MNKKRRWLALAALWLLSGCGSVREEKAFEEWRSQLERAAEITFDTKITAHWEDAADTFSVHVTHREGETEATVTEPETIAGITFRRGEGDWLQFDDLVLELDAGHSNAISPCEAPALLIEAVLEGWPRSYASATGCQVIELEAQGGETVMLTRGSDGTPLRCEILRGGATELTLTIDHWEIKE